jgi:hypothetical protein
MGICDKPTAPRSPLQNERCERLIGSIRRECLDHVVIFIELHLRHILLSYHDYYNGARSHLTLRKDTPISRAMQSIETIRSTQFSEDYIINMPGFNLRQGQASFPHRIAIPRQWPN